MKRIIVFLMLIFSLASGQSLDFLLGGEDYDSLLTEENLTERKGSIRELKGEAYLEDGNNWLQLVARDNIVAGDTMITLDNTRVDIALDKDIDIVIGEKTKVYFENLLGDIKTEEINDTSMELMFGKVYSNVRRRLTGGGKFEINSGSVVAGVRGTRFSVRAFRDGRVEIRVFEGFVQVRDKVTDEMRDVYEQEYMILDADGQLLEVGDHDELDEAFSEVLEDYIDVDIKELEKVVTELEGTVVIDSDVIESIQDRVREEAEKTVETNRVIIIVE